MVTEKRSFGERSETQKPSEGFKPRSEEKERRRWEKS
jgi:hypothetical protein